MVFESYKRYSCILNFPYGLKRNSWKKYLFNFSYTNIIVRAPDKIFSLLLEVFEMFTHIFNGTQTKLFASKKFIYLYCKSVFFRKKTLLLNYICLKLIWSLKKQHFFRQSNIPNFFWTTSLTGKTQYSIK